MRIIAFFTGPKIVGAVAEELRIVGYPQTMDGDDFVHCQMITDQDEEADRFCQIAQNLLDSWRTPLYT